MKPVARVYPLVRMLALETYDPEKDRALASSLMSRDSMQRLSVNEKKTKEKMKEM